MTRTALIVRLLSSGRRDYAAIAAETKSSLGYVKYVSSTRGFARRRDGSRTRRLVAMWNSGERDYSALAEQCGLTPGSVRVLLSRLGLTRVGNCRMLLVPVPLAMVEEAAERGVDPRDLAGAVLSGVDEGELYAAVLGA